jgi:hypothetical protein
LEIDRQLLDLVLFEPGDMDDFRIKSEAVDRHQGKDIHNSPTGEDLEAALGVADLIIIEDYHPKYPEDFFHMSPVPEYWLPVLGYWFENSESGHEP